MTNFDEAFEFTVGHEGGYVNDPVDPGGETKYGISKKSYPMLNIKDLSIEDAKLIYEKDYWMPAGCDRLPYPLNLVVFDNAVHSGVKAALDNLRLYPDWRDLIVERIEDMLDIVERRPASLKYLKGWIRRTVGLYRKAHSTGHPISEEINP